MFRISNNMLLFGFICNKIPMSRMQFLRYSNINTCLAPFVGTNLQFHIVMYIIWIFVVLNYGRVSTLHPYTMKCGR